MSYIILCSGSPCHDIKRLYCSSEFDAAVAAMMHAESVSPVIHTIDASARPLLIAEGRLALSTAEQVLQPRPETFMIEPLLNEIPLRSYEDTDKAISMEKWIRRAARQRKSGNPRQSESRIEVLKRADRLIDKLESEYSNALLITYPLFLIELLERFRLRSYVIQRSGLFRIEPLEKILISRRDEHCGGCQHNCFLSNPGCGIGRDKAMRQHDKA